MRKLPENCKSKAIIVCFVVYVNRGICRIHALQGLFVFSLIQNIVHIVHFLRNIQTIPAKQPAGGRDRKQGRNEGAETAQGHKPEVSKGTSNNMSCYCRRIQVLSCPAEGMAGRRRQG